MSDSQSFITIENLSFYRGERAIFKDLDVSFPRGKITAIVGPSGTGKTTLLIMIGGQLTPESGKVIVDGKNLSELSRTEILELRRESMGMLFQAGALFTDLSRSEEHTSELQSCPHLVCRLLLEKKKKTQNILHTC